MEDLENRTNEVSGQEFSPENMPEDLEFIVQGDSDEDYSADVYSTNTYSADNYDDGDNLDHADATDGFIKPQEVVQSVAEDARRQKEAAELEEPVQSGKAGPVSRRLNKLYERVAPVAMAMDDSYQKYREKHPNSFEKFNKLKESWRNNVEANSYFFTNLSYVTSRVKDKDSVQRQMDRVSRLEEADKQRQENYEKKTQNFYRNLDSMDHQAHQKVRENDRKWGDVDKSAYMLWNYFRSLFKLNFHFIGAVTNKVDQACVKTRQTLFDNRVKRKAKDMGALPPKQRQEQVKTEQVVRAVLQEEKLAKKAASNSKGYRDTQKTEKTADRKPSFSSEKENTEEKKSGKKKEALKKAFKKTTENTKKIGANVERVSKKAMKKAKETAKERKEKREEKQAALAQEIQQTVNPETVQTDQKDVTAKKEEKPVQEPIDHKPKEESVQSEDVSVSENMTQEQTDEPVISKTSESIQAAGNAAVTDMSVHAETAETKQEPVKAMNQDAVKEEPELQAVQNESPVKEDTFEFHAENHIPEPDMSVSVEISETNQEPVLQAVQNEPSVKEDVFESYAENDIPETDMSVSSEIMEPEQESVQVIHQDAVKEEPKLQAVQEEPSVKEDVFEPHAGNTIPEPDFILEPIEEEQQSEIVQEPAKPVLNGTSTHEKAEETKTGIKKMDLDANLDLDDLIVSSEISMDADIPEIKTESVQIAEPVQASEKKQEKEETAVLKAEEPDAGAEYIKEKAEMNFARSGRRSGRTARVRKSNSVLLNTAKVNFDKDPDPNQILNAAQKNLSRTSSEPNGISL